MVVNALWAKQRLYWLTALLMIRWLSYPFIRLLVWLMLSAVHGCYHSTEASSRRSFHRILK